MKTDKIKKTPLRMCIVCKKMLPKAELIRVVKAPDGSMSFDKTGKKNGRGAYLCDSKECVEKCLKKKLLNKAFKINVDDAIYQKLAEEYESNEN